MKRLQAFLFLSLALAAGPLHAARIGIGGRVVGVDGKPATNVKVALVPVLLATQLDRLELEGKTAADDSFTAAATATTDAAGLFQLTAPDVGMWKVRVEAAGCVPLETLLVPLTQDAELGDARLVADAGLRVKVTDPQGRPAARAWVRAEAPRDDSSDPWQIPPRRVAFTDAQGVATLPRARDEVLTVRAAAVGAVPGTRKNVHEGSTEIRLAAGATRTLEVRDGGAKGKGIADVFVTLAESGWPVGRTAESGRLDLAVPADGADLRLATADGRRMSYRLHSAKPEELKPGQLKPGQTTPAVIVLKPAAPASGRVVAAGGAAGGAIGGQPVAGALAWLSGDAGAVARSGADGSIRFAHLPEEATVVLAGAAGFLPTSARTTAGHLPTLSLIPRLTVGGVVVDEAGKPVAGAAVTTTAVLFPVALRSVATLNLFARSAASGRFQVTRLAAGVAYEMRVAREGFAPATVKLPARAAGAPAPDLRVVLRLGRTVFGAVIEGSGRRPVAGARVTLHPTLPQGSRARLWESLHPAGLPEGATDAAGHFEIPNLPAGTFDLTVLARGFAPLTVPALAVPEGNGRTDLGTVALAPGGSVHGVVADSQGEPVADAEVRAQGSDRSGPRASVFTAADGTFTLADLAPGVSLNLVAEHPGYGPGTAPGVAVPSAAPVRIVLPPTSRVSGRVSGPDGKPVAGATVSLREIRRGSAMMALGSRTQQAMTDDDGGFSLEGVAPGPIYLAAEAPRYQRAELTGLEVKPGQDLAGIELVAAAGAAVEGRVLSAEGRPVPGAEVSVTAPSANRFGSSRLAALTDEDGHYRIEAIPPGAHTLEALAKGYRRAVRDVEAAAETHGVDFQLAPWPGSVSGRVIDDAGTPVPDAEVEADGDARDPQGATSAADGSFSITGVPDGTLSLTASKTGYLDHEDKKVTVAGAAVSGIELRLSAGDATITGQLIGLDFSQLSRVRVRVEPGYHLDATVDAGGTYKVLHLSAGTWRVSAAVPDTQLHAEGTVTIEAGTQEARLDLHFGGGHELDGVVVRNGEPLAAAGLSLYRTDTLATSQRGTTDYQGSFRFGGLDDGSYSLTVSTPNGSLHKEQVEIAGDRTIRVELRTASLAGRILDATDGSPVAGARISLNAADGSFSFSSGAITDARGVFHLPEIAEGEWTVRASQDGYAPGERKVQIAGDAPPDDVEIRLDPTQGITVEAQLAGGQPPERLQAAALDAAGRTVATGYFVTGENGRTRISNVPAGSWLLVVQGDSSAPVTLAVSVPGPVLPVLLPPPGQVHIQGPNDATAKVTLTGESGGYRALSWNGTVLSEWNLAEGTLTLDRVPAGIWRVVARGADGREWSGTATVAPGGAADVALK